MEENKTGAYEWIAHVVRPILTVAVTAAFLYQILSMGNVNQYLVYAFFGCFIWWFGERTVMKAVEGLKGLQVSAVQQALAVTQTTQTNAIAAVETGAAAQNTPTNFNEPPASSGDEVVAPKPDLVPYFDPDLTDEGKVLVSKYINRQVTDPPVVPDVAPIPAPAGGYKSPRAIAIEQNDTAKAAIAKRRDEVFDKTKDYDPFAKTMACDEKPRLALYNGWIEARDLWQKYGWALADAKYPV